MLVTKLSKASFFDRPAVLAMMERKEAVALRKAGGMIRLTARRSIRRVKGKSSDPGKPPHTQTGWLRNDIVFGFDPSTRTVVSGPHRTNWLGPLHEFGGFGKQRVLLKERPIAIGDFAPIRGDATGRVVRTRIRTDKQARLATKVREEANKARAKNHRYAPRPFMGPALTKIAPSLPTLWARSGAA